MRSVRSAACLLALLAGAPATTPAVPATTAPEAAIDAAVLYHDHCSVCHGDRGDGRSRATGLVPPPRDFTAPDAAVSLDRARMIAAVRDGVPGTAMAPWRAQLDDASIAALVDYVRESFMRPASAEAGAGARVYARNCSVCHGDNGRGAMWTRSSMSPAPRDFGSERARRELTRERMVTSVTYGRADTAMPGFGVQLSTAEIEAVVDHVRATFIAGDGAAEDHPHAAGELPGHAHGAHAVTADMSAAAPHGLAPDAGRGEATYRQNCVACHGEIGDGRGPRAYFILPKPRNFTHPASRSTLNRPALFDAISAGSVGTEMPAWRAVLDRQAIADVAEYVFVSFIRPRAGATAAGVQ